MIPSTGRVVACDRERHQATIALDVGRCGGCRGGHCARRERTVACFVDGDVTPGQRVAVIAPRGSALRAFTALLGGPVVVAALVYPIAGTAIAIGAAIVLASIGALALSRRNDRPIVTPLRVASLRGIHRESSGQTDIQTDA